MMGTQSSQRHPALFSYHIDLEHRVAADHLLRQVAALLDLSFVIPTELNYKEHRLVDDAHGVITAVAPSASNVPDGSQLPGLYEDHVSNTGLKPAQVTIAADHHYGTASNYIYCAQQQVRAHLADASANLEERGKLPLSQFVYEPSQDRLRCPAGHYLVLHQDRPEEQAKASNAGKAIDFYKEVFGAKELSRLPLPGGKIGHAEIQIGDSRIMLADEFPEWDARSPETIGGSPVIIALYVEDVDAVVGRAVAAGARLFKPVADQFYGDRSGSITVPFGHKWNIATHKEDVYQRKSTNARPPSMVRPETTATSM